jgi:hypothetical protein
MPDLVFVKLGRYLMPSEAISTVYFTNPFQKNYHTALVRLLSYSLHFTSMPQPIVMKVNMAYLVFSGAYLTSTFLQ